MCAKNRQEGTEVRVGKYKMRNVPWGSGSNTFIQHKFGTHIQNI